MGQRLTDKVLRARQRAKVEERERKEVARDERRAEKRRGRYEKADSLGKKIMDESPEEVEARRYRRAHHKAEWDFARYARAHMPLLKKRRRERLERMLGHGYETDGADYQDSEGEEGTSHAETEAKGATPKRLYARELLQN